MAFIQRKKKQDDEEPGIEVEGLGLGMDLNLMVCPVCRREVPDWRDTCETCHEAPVLKASMPTRAPEVPFHLLLPDPELEALKAGELDYDEEEEVEDELDQAEALEDEYLGKKPGSKKGIRRWLKWK